MLTLKIIKSHRVELHTTTKAAVIYKDDAEFLNFFGDNTPKDCKALVVADDCNYPAYLEDSFYIVNSDGKTVHKV